jgi:hypothetical protein
MYDDVDNRRISKTESSISLETSLSEVPSCEKSSSDAQIDSQISFLELVVDTDRLWKRKSTSITNIGHVDSLGR